MKSLTLCTPNFILISLPAAPNVFKSHLKFTLTKEQVNLNK